MHIGHLRMIQESAKMAQIVVVGVNSDEWLMRKKGYVFMSCEERIEMVQGIRGVAKAIEFDDNDNSACDLLRRVRGLWPDFKVALGVHLIWGVGGGKIQSSRELVSSQPRFASLGKGERKS